MITGDAALEDCGRGDRASTGVLSILPSGTSAWEVMSGDPTSDISTSCTCTSGVVLDTPGLMGMHE